MSRIAVILVRQAALAAVAFMSMTAALAQAPAPAAKAPAAASSKGYTAPRTPDGQPDLQGIWSSATVTPLERPAEFANKEFLTPAEVVEYERAARERNNQDNRSKDRTTDVASAYNDAWWDRGTKVVKTRRTSLVVDPPNGRLPARTPEALAKLSASMEAQRMKCRTAACSEGTLSAADGPEDRPPGERCIVWGSSVPPMIPSAYNNNYQIVQTAGYVAILIEMIHDVRIIPIDGTPHMPSKVRTWLGDSRGHWEGDALVVETKNFNGQAAKEYDTSFKNASKNFRLVERFTRTDAETLTYRYTVEDPQTFTRPFTVELPLARSSEPLYEYACHEGNYGMTGLLEGAREIEKARELEKNKK